MFLPGERLLKKNILLGTAPALSKQWKVSFEFKPTSYNHNGWAQIMHMTTGSKKVRAPALWIFKRKEIVIRTSLNGKPNEGHSSVKTPPINKWSKVEVSQERLGSDYIFSLKLRGKTIWSQKNTQPKESSNVKVYAASNWYVAQAGYIRGFKIQNKILGKYLETTGVETLIYLKHFFNVLYV